MLLHATENNCAAALLKVLLAVDETADRPGGQHLLQERLPHRGHGRGRGQAHQRSSRGGRLGGHGRFGRKIGRQKAGRSWRARFGAVLTEKLHRNGLIFEGKKTEFINVIAVPRFVAGEIGEKNSRDFPLKSPGNVGHCPVEHEPHARASYHFCHTWFLASGTSSSWLSNIKDVDLRGESISFKKRHVKEKYMI